MYFFALPDFHRARAISIAYFTIYFGKRECVTLCSLLLARDMTVNSNALLTQLLKIEWCYDY